MFNSNNISATFNVNGIPGSKAFGYGSVDFAGVSVNYTVYPSPHGLGIMVSYPSRPRMKGGVQERDANNRPMYVNEVFIRDINIRNLADEAVLNAMANKGVYTQQSAQQAQAAGQYVQQVVQPVASTRHTFDNPEETTQTPQKVIQPVATPAPTPTYTPPPQTVMAGNSTVCDDDLPF